jgi:hypothetical protein
MDNSNRTTATARNARPRHGAAAGNGGQRPGAGPGAAAATIPSRTVGRRIGMRHRHGRISSRGSDR